MANSNEQAIAQLLNSGRMPQNNDKGLLALLKTTFSNVMMNYHAVSISHRQTGNCYDSTYYGY